MMTKYEKSKLMAEARKKHLANIEELRGKLADARDLLAVIPDSGFDTSRERQTVREEIKTLSEFMADEEAALKSTFEDEAAADEIISKLGI